MTQPDGIDGTDEVAEWREAQERVCAVVEELTDAEVEQKVPACPDWTVRDLLSHMVGLGADVLDGDEPDDHNATWTAAQVEARQGRTASELVAEWRALTDDLCAWMRDHGTRPLGDVVIHEHDLRGAVDRPGGRDHAGFRAVADRMTGRFAGRVEALPPIALVGQRRTWVSRGSVEEAAVVLRADDFDLGRAVMSRRSAEQLREWTVRGDVSAYLGAFEVLGPLPGAPLTDGAGAS